MMIIECGVNSFTICPNKALSQVDMTNEEVKRKAIKWTKSPEGRKALNKAIKKSDEFKKQLYDLEKPMSHIDHTVINI